jgi:enoyl-CoA hydratase/carnithine racemase
MPHCKTTQGLVPINGIIHEFVKGEIKMADILLQERTEDGILILTLNRPDAMNCFNFDLLAVLADVIREANFDMDLRCIIITGSKAGDEPKKWSFSTGADLKERRTLTQDQVRRFIFTIRNTFTAVEQVRVPVIAAINGFAFGGGTELALACDIRVASSNVLMGLTETSLAIIPGAGGTQRLPRIVGVAKAKELIYTARRFNAQTALEIGLVSKVVEPDKLMDAALELAREIAKNGPIGVAQAKFVLNYGSEASLGVALPLESKAYEVTIPTKDRLEALAAFAEKRKPVFKGE